MRIGITLYKYDVARGGVERYADTLARALLQSGHEVHIFATGATGLPEGAQFEPVRHLSFWGPVRALTFARGVASKLERARPGMDAVLGLGRADRQDVYRVGGGSHLAHLRAMKPWTRARWGSTLIRFDPRHGTFLALERRILQGWRGGRTLRYLCNARRVRDEIIADYGVPHERIDVLHNPVDTARFRPDRWHGTRGETRRALGLPEEAYVLLFAGSGFERKGLDTAIRAVAASGGQARLLVAGGGDPASYRALAHDLRMEDRVVFAGRRTDIERMYAASDAFLLPTRYDAFANATTEALAMGLPAITTGMNGASEVITEGREGFIVPIPDDVENLGLAVKRLAAPALRAEMAERARKRAEMLCPAAYADGVVKVLEAAIAMRGGRA